MNNRAQHRVIALAGLPNCGKTSFFNALTGSQQKVANYPGVTVEKKEGLVQIAGDESLRIIDLPGTYSLDARTPDEEIARDVLLGRVPGEELPELVVAVVDATNLDRNLGLVLELRDLGVPLVLALNMMDLAKKRGLDLDLSHLSNELQIPVVPTVAVKRSGRVDILKTVSERLKAVPRNQTTRAWKKSTTDEVRERFQTVDQILKKSTYQRAAPSLWTEKIDRILLHPFFGYCFLLFILGLMFQAIFSGAAVPQAWIEGLIAGVSRFIGSFLNEGPLKSLLLDGVISGIGSVLVFLPQILILFTFILVLEDSGYLARAAFMMDRVMGGVGLHGRAFIPLLSSYACAIPGILSTRTIANPKDRLATILVAPLTTCSARLPVYTLLVGAFIPNARVVGPIYLQGVVLFGLYVAGTISALMVAWVLRKTVLQGPKPSLLMELPTYKCPHFRGILLGLLERAKIFLRRAGTVILSLSILVWFLSSYPKPKFNDSAVLASGKSAIHYSFAGRIGQTIEPLIRPLGFDWRIGVALIPGFAAREVMVSALGTVYAIEGTDEEVQHALKDRLVSSWSLATALSLIIWYIFAPQCLSTLAVVRRETNSWRWPLFMLFYMTALAYLASFSGYQLIRFFGGTI